MSEDEENFVKRLSISPNLRSLQDISSIREYLKYIEALSGYKNFTISEFARIARHEKYEVNHRLFKIGDKCTSWYILLSGCVLVGQTMFFPRKSFGHRSQGTICRYDDCVILEKTELIVIDYNLDRHSQVGSMGSKQAYSSYGILDNPSYGTVSERSSHVSDTSSAFSGCDIANLSYENVSENDDNDPDADSLSQDINSINDFFYDIIVKEPSRRSESDNETILDGVHNLSAFTNFTAKTKFELCRAMRTIHVNNAYEQILADGILIETWNVILDGIIEIRYKDGRVREYSRGDSFGVKPNNEEQLQDGDLWTITPSCLFLCVNQKDFCEIISRNSDAIIPETEDNGRVVLVYEERNMSSDSGNTSRIIVKGRIEKLLNNLLVDQSKSDPMYMENFLLTYRVFMKSPKVLAAKLCQWYEAEPVGVVTNIKATIRRCILLWARYHFEDLDNPCADMNEYFEKFDKLLSDEAYSAQYRTLFFKICSTNSKERSLTVHIQKDEIKKLPFRLIGLQMGLGLFIKEVYSKTSNLRCGDQILLLENYSWEVWESLEKVLKKLKSNSTGSIDMIVKYNPSEFHTVLNELSVTKSEKKYDSSDTRSLTKSASVTPSVNNKRLAIITPMLLPQPDELMPVSSRVKLKTNSRSANTSPSRRNARSKSKVDEVFQSERLTGSGLSLNPNKKLQRCSSSTNSANTKSYRPEVLKVFKPNSSDSKLVLMTNNTSAKEAVVLIMKEFSIDPSEVVKYCLYLVTVDDGSNGLVTKASRISPFMKDLAGTLALNQRYYLKYFESDSQLITDEQAKLLLKESKVTLNQLNPFEIATRLTLIDYALFRDIQAAEYINHHLNLPSLEEIDSSNDSNIESSKSDQSKNNTEGFSTGCGNYIKFQDLINNESFWPTTEICLETNVSKRADLIKKFIEVAKICKDLKNFNSLFCIIMGLDLTPVQRLKASWDKVPNKCMKTFEKLKCLTDFSFNFRQIRQLVLPEISEPPIIPYLAIHYKDLATIHMGNKTCSKDGLINFEKLRMMASEIRKLTTMCSTSYNLQNIISSSASRNTSNLFTFTLIRSTRNPSIDESDTTSGISSCSNNSNVTKRRSNSVDQFTYNATLKKKYIKRQTLTMCESPIKSPKKIYDEWLSTLKVRTYLLNLNVNKNPDHLQELSNCIEPPSNKSISSSANILLPEPRNYDQTGYSKTSSNKSSMSITISQSSLSPSPSPAELLFPSNLNTPPNSEKHSDIAKPQELNGRPLSIFSFQNHETNVTLRELMQFKGKVSRNCQILSRDENSSREQSFNLGMDQNYLRNLPMYKQLINKQLMRELSTATVTHQENNDDLLLEGVSSYLQPSISNSLFEKKNSERGYRYPMAGGHLNNYYYGDCFGDRRSCLKPDLPSYETAKAITQNQKLNTNLHSTALNNKSTITKPPLFPKPVYPPPYNQCLTPTTNVPSMLPPRPVNSSKTCKSSEPLSNFNNIN